MGASPYPLRSTHEHISVGDSGADCNHPTSNKETIPASAAP